MEETLEESSTSVNQNYVNSILSETTSELTQKQSTPSLSIPLILIITILIALIFTCFIVYWTFSKKQIDKSPEKKSLDKINNEIENYSNLTTISSRISSSSHIDTISDPLITYNIPMISANLIQKDKIIGRF